jgi:AraC-like DNA-binding protein
VGTERGLCLHRGETFESYTIRDGLSNNYINSIYEDGDHNLWVGTSNSLNFVKNGEFTSANIKKYLKGVPISSIYEDKRKVLWIGTYGLGLKRFKGGEFFSFTGQNGLSCNNIHKIIEDETGNFWISSDSGVLKVSKNELNEAAAGNMDEINCVLFGLSDGMKSIECSRSTLNSAIRTQNGEIWFATKNGISVIDPGKIRINKFPPTVIIERIRLNGRQELQNIRVNDFKVKGDRINDVVIDFTATTFISPEKVKFKYMLKGYDLHWRYSESGLQRNADYPGLPPGRYTFKVTAGNSDGVWSKPGDFLTFTLQPGFFKTVLFKILLVCLLLCAAIALYFIYKKNFFKQEGKYKNSHLNRERDEEYLKKLLYLLEIEKVYRDENISLQLLSEKSEIPPHYLSRVINEKMNKNFISLINGFRVEEAKKRLADPKDKHLSILGIAFDVGFNSKAAFNRAFKRHTGMTPSGYKKKRSQ